MAELFQKQKSSKPAKLGLQTNVHATPITTTVVTGYGTVTISSDTGNLNLQSEIDIFANKLKTL